VKLGLGFVTLNKGLKCKGAVEVESSPGGFMVDSTQFNQVKLGHDNEHVSFLYSSLWDLSTNFVD
jgi:hypothetical protein